MSSWLAEVNQTAASQLEECVDRLAQSSRGRSLFFANIVEILAPLNERVQDVFHVASAAATAAIDAAVNAAESAAEHAVQVAVDVVEGIEEAIEDFEEVAEQLIDGLIDMIWPKDCGDGPLEPAQQRGGRSWSRGDAPCGSTTVPHISSTHSTRSARTSVRMAGASSVRSGSWTLRRSWSLPSP